MGKKTHKPPIFQELHSLPLPKKNMSHYFFFFFFLIGKQYQYMCISQKKKNERSYTIRYLICIQRKNQKVYSQQRENTKRSSIPHIDHTQSTKSIKGIVLSTTYILTQNNKILTKVLFSDKVDCSAFQRPFNFFPSIKSKKYIKQDGYLDLLFLSSHAQIVRT